MSIFVAINCTSKFTYVELHPRMTKMIAAGFLRQTLKALPYKIHTILTDDGIQLTNRKKETPRLSSISLTGCAVKTR